MLLITQISLICKWAIVDRGTSGSLAHALVAWTMNNSFVYYLHKAVVSLQLVRICTRALLCKTGVTNSVSIGLAIGMVARPAFSAICAHGTRLPEFPSHFPGLRNRGKIAVLRKPRYAPGTRIDHGMTVVFPGGSGAQWKTRWDVH